jgi:nucleoside-diphosphate-sugar epimerase
VDVVFYGAAITAGVEREISDPLSVFDVNVIGLLNVLKAACRAPSVNRIINISSGSAYGNGGFGDTGWKDSLDEFGTREDPQTLYAISKYAGERVALRMGELLKKRVINVRLSAIFGRWEYDTGVRDTLSAPMQATLLALKGATALIDRKEERDWTYSRDVARALYQLANHENVNSSLYNISSGKTWSVFDWCAVLKKSYPDFNYRLCEFGEVPNIDLFGTRDRIKMSPDRFLCDIGYTLSEDLNEIFKDFKIWLNESNGFWNLEP